MKLFISDIDGTLIRSDEKISPYTKQSIIELIESDVHFTVASARSLTAIRHVLGDIPFKLPVISFNGAFLADFDTDERFTVHNINPETVRAIDELVCSQGLRPILSTYEDKDKVYIDDNGSNDGNQGMAWYRNDRTQAKDQRLQQGFDRKHLYQQKVTCINVIATKEQLLKLKPEVEKNFGNKLQLHLFENMYSPGWYWLTMHDHLATKGNACRELCERIGVETEDLTVFGDHLNDVEMFKMAGHAVAVENAEPELKDLADKVIGHHNDDSVIRYIQATRYGKADPSR